MIPRSEYPRPQMVRDGFINLNGNWEFSFDFNKSGKEKGYFLPGCKNLNETITVPFCPESKLSGIGYTDFIPAVWYRKTVTLTEEQLSGRVLLHFGAVDYSCEVWINGHYSGSHKGGYSSFTLDIKAHAVPGDNTITLYAEDDARSRNQPRGKQSNRLNSYECLYTRTTGIWQTVWLEFVADRYIDSYRAVSDPKNGLIHFSVKLAGDIRGMTLKTETSLNGCLTGTTTVLCSSTVEFTIKLSKVECWDIGKGTLYDFNMTLQSESTCTDKIKGYFGLRTIEWCDKKVYLNGRSIFQRLVLDQGYYPDGIYTAPTDEALRQDILMSLELGFNGARLHERTFEPRYLYHADKLGYLVWGEMGNWGLDMLSSEAIQAFLPEWLEIVERDFNHPSIIGWCPFNETIYPPRSAKQNDEALRIVYRVTKAIDITRPVIDTSGYIHVETDIYDIHDYNQDPVDFRSKLEPMLRGEPVHDPRGHEQSYGGQPYFVSEYGGTWWSKNEHSDDSWGYGEQVMSENEVRDRYVGLTSAMLENPLICGFCYTQLYDVEQEQNGLYTYSREKKFSDETYAAILACNKASAAIE